MSKTPIKTDEYCINNLLEVVSNELGDKAAEQLKQTAVEIVQNCVDVYDKTFGAGDVGATGSGIVSKPHKGEIPNGTTGLIYGKVQSGKTKTTIATLAMAQANGFRCFIVLTSNNVWLGKQTARRFKNQLEGGPVVFNWEQWKKDPGEFATQQLRDYIKETGVVLVSTKQKDHLDKLLKVLKVLKDAKARDVPTIIFDDEADNASLNTNEAKQAKKGKDTVPDSFTFDKIGKIREEVANHIYLQITATPQSLLLQNIDHECKPAFCVLSKPGEKYMGGDLFFEDDRRFCYTAVKPEELDMLKQQGGNIKPGNNWNIPNGLKLALCCFFLGSIYKMKSADRSAVYSFLAHICHKRINHSNLEKVIRNFVVELDKAIRGQSSATKQEEALKCLKQAHGELSKTAPDLPSVDDLVTELKYKLRNAIPEVINADNPNKEVTYNPGMNILIGGNRLGRGVTIEGLMVTYYGRDPKQMDTVHQHARMYGYRPELLDVTRLFVPQHIYEDFCDIHGADEGMRQAIGDDPSSIKIKPVWVGRKLKPTRSNVLNPGEIEAFTPGSAIFPWDPFWKASEVKENTELLDKLLKEYRGNNDEYYSVDIDFLIRVLEYMPSKPCFGATWEDKRVQEALTAMKAEGIQKGRLNVRQNILPGRTNKRFWRGTSGFADPEWIRKPKRDYPDVPTLIVRREKGEKAKDWDEQPLYLPTLIFPKNKFVFMFNYSESSED